MRNAKGNQTVYATDFIIAFLAESNQAVTTSEIRNALRDSGILIKDSSLNWTLTNLNSRGLIHRVGRGVYRIHEAEQKFLDDAKVRRQKGRLEEALRAYESAIEHFPADAIAFNGRAEVLREMGRHDEALRAYESAIEHFPADAIAFNGRAEVLREMGRHDEVLRAYESAIERFPANPVAYNGRAEVLREMGRHDEALRAYESAIERFPANPVAYNGRAEVLREMGRHDEVLRAYESAIERFPADAIAFNGRAEVLREMGRHDEALRAYESAIERFPANPVAYNGRAEVLREMGRHDEALRAYESAIEHFPADLIAFIGRAEVLREMGRHDEALRAYESAIERFPANPVAYNGRAEVLREMGRHEEALRAYESAIEQFPADVYIYNRRAEVLREMGDFDEALQAYERVIEQFPGDVVAHNGRAEVLRVMGRIEAALRPSEDVVPPPPDAIPAPERRALQFMSVSDGPIDLAALSQPGEHLLGGPNQQEDYRELRVKAGEISVLGSNRLGRLYGPINRFLSLSENLDQVRAKLFWSRINTLRLILLSHEQTTKVRNGEPDERRLEPTVASLLKDLVETINVFVVGDPGLMELDAVRPGPKETEIAKEETSVLGPMIDDLANNPNVATESAREILSEQAENLETADASLPGRQAAEFGRRSIQNFVGELLRRAYAPVRALSRQAASEVGVAWKGVREGAYRAVGAGLITGAVTDLVGVTDFSGAIIRFVIRHAEALIAYVTKSFQNPALVEIINWIVRLGS